MGIDVVVGSVAEALNDQRLNQKTGDNLVFLLLPF
jgi:hypothetical protein